MFWLSLDVQRFAFILQQAKSWYKQMQIDTEESSPNGCYWHNIGGDCRASAYQRKHITIMIWKCMIICAISYMILMFSASLFMIVSLVPSLPLALCIDFGTKIVVSCFSIKLNSYFIGILCEKRLYGSSSYAYGLTTAYDTRISPVRVGGEILRSRITKMLDWRYLLYTYMRWCGVWCVAHILCRS